MMATMIVYMFDTKLILAPTTLQYIIDGAKEYLKQIALINVGMESLKTNEQNQERIIIISKRKQIAVRYLSREILHWYVK
jgi:hypothetical protein